MVNPSVPASDSRHFQHAQIYRSQTPTVNEPSTSRNNIPFSTPTPLNTSNNVAQIPSRRVSFTRTGPLVRHSSQGFAVSSTDAFNQNYQPPPDHQDDSDEDEDDKYLNIANNNGIVFTYPVKVKENKTTKPKPAATPTKIPAPTTPSKQPAVTPTKIPAPIASSKKPVKFRKSSHEEKIQLNEEQKRKIHRRQTGRLGVVNGKVSLIDFDDEDEEDERSNKSGGSKQEQAIEDSFEPIESEPASPRNSVGSGSYKDAATTPPTYSPPSSPPRIPSAVADKQVDKNAKDNKDNPKDNHKGQTNSSQPPPPPPSPPPEKEKEQQQQQEPTNNSSGGGCNTSAPGCTCGGAQAQIPKNIQATLLQCYEVPYRNDHQNHGKTILEKRKNNCCQLSYNCCSCCCQPSSPTFKPCSCRRCRVYHYCFNVLNRTQINPEEMYIGVSKYEDLKRGKENAINYNTNDDMSCQQNSTGAKNWTNGPPEGYTDNPRETEQGAQGPFIQPSDRKTSLVDPACCFKSTWQTEYTSQFTDFSDQMRKSRSKYPSYEEGGMGKGGGNNSNNCGASPCCGGGGGCKQMRSSFCYDSRNQNSGCGNYVQTPEEEVLQGSSFGAEFQCCATGGGNSNCCRPPSYYVCQLLESNNNAGTSCNNNTNVMDNEEYNTRRFKTNELMSSCGSGAGRKRVRAASHWLAGGGGADGGETSCDDEGSITNFVPKLETFPATRRRDKYDFDFLDYDVNPSFKGKKKRKSSDGSAGKGKKTDSNNSEDQEQASGSTKKSKKSKKTKKRNSEHSEGSEDEGVWVKTTRIITTVKKPATAESNPPGSDTGSKPAAVESNPAGSNTTSKHATESNPSGTKTGTIEIAEAEENDMDLDDIIMGDDDDDNY